MFWTWWVGSALISFACVLPDADATRRHTATAPRPPTPTTCSRQDPSPYPSQTEIRWCPEFFGEAAKQFCRLAEILIRQALNGRRRRGYGICQGAGDGKQWTDNIDWNIGTQPRSFRRNRRGRWIRPEGEGGFRRSGAVSGIFCTMNRCIHHIHSAPARQPSNMEGRRACSEGQDHAGVLRCGRVELISTDQPRYRPRPPTLGARRIYIYTRCLTTRSTTSRKDSVAYSFHCRTDSPEPSTHTTTTTTTTTPSPLPSRVLLP